jgi:hypothetical protein
MLAEILRRVWRGAWKPTFKRSVEWWSLLDWPYRLREMFGALFILFAPLWIGMIIYYEYSTNPKKALFGAGVFSVLWVVLTLLAYWHGREEPPKGQTRRKEIGTSITQSRWAACAPLGGGAAEVHYRHETMRGAP